MEIKKLKELNNTEMQKLLASTREKVRDLRFRVSMGQLKDVREIREGRQLIARILTLLKIMPEKK